MTEVASLTFANIYLDVQIVILTFLHPSDILALRKTCKALQRCTQKRVVWVAALHRVCLDNALFLPSFPISDMSVLELEKSAMAPRRWINLCGAFEQPKSVHLPGGILRPRATRIIDGAITADDYTEFFLVPGGRYLLSYSSDIISVLDLGYTSSADYKLVASVELKDGCDVLFCRAQATPDGMGLTILTPSSSGNSCSVYEIYPQSETPHLTQIAHLDSVIDFNEGYYTLLLPGKVFWFIYHEDRIVFRVWDYRLNHSISFSVDVDVKKFKVDVMATKTAVIVICQAVLIYAIPPLSPRPPNSFDRNPTHIRPLFTIPFPDGIVDHSEPLHWRTLSSWYFGSSSLYFDMFCQDSKLYRFQITLKPDLSTASLHVINSSEHQICHQNFTSFVVIPHENRICEDTLVSCWFYQYHTPPGQYQCGVYSGLKLTRFGVISHGGPEVEWSLPNEGRELLFLFACPASGRSVLMDIHNHCVVVFDFF